MDYEKIKELKGGTKFLVTYLSLFVLCLLTVAHVLSVWITLVIVPAALLLSGFTENNTALIIGTKGKYFISFTVANIIFLAVLIILHVVIR